MRDAIKRPGENRIQAALDETHTKIDYKKLTTYLTTKKKPDGNLPLPIDDRLYDDNDFYITSDDNPNAYHNPRAIKAGNLYINFKRSSDGNYEAILYRIDYQKRTLRYLFDFNHNRHGLIDTGSVLPLLHNQDTEVPHLNYSALDSRIMDMFRRLHEKLLKMALEEDLEEADLAPILVELYRYKDNPEQNIAGQVRQNMRDVTDFAESPSLVPRTEAEVAAKITAIYYFELGISISDIERIFEEYLQESGKTIEQINTNRFIYLVMNAPIDSGRYKLSSIFPEQDRGSILQKALTYLTCRYLDVGSSNNSHTAVASNTSPNGAELFPVESYGVIDSLDRLRDHLYAIGQTKWPDFLKHIGLEKFMEILPAPQDLELLMLQLPSPEPGPMQPYLSLVYFGLLTYVRRREAEPDHTTTFLGVGLGSSKAQKIEAAQQLMTAIRRGEPIEPTPAMITGKLGYIYKECYLSAIQAQPSASPAFTFSPYVDISLQHEPEA